MEWTYRDNKVQKLCETPREFKRQFGSEALQRLELRFDQLRQSIDLAELMALPGRWHGLERQYAKHVAATITGTLRIVGFVGVDAKGVEARAGVTEIEIVTVENYHTG